LIFIFVLQLIWMNDRKQLLACKKENESLKMEYNKYRRCC
jgi:hypothetical protein